MLSWENGIKDVIQSDDRQWPLKLSVILSISMALGPLKIKVRLELSKFSEKFGLILLTICGGGD